jgi:hypothetical protein
MDTPKTLDACSGSAVGLADKINQAAQSGDRGAQTWLKAGTAIEALAAAQAQAKAEIDVAKASLNAGTISLEQYNTQILETKAGLALFEDEHRKAQIALREHIASTNAATGATGAQKAGLMQLTQQLGDMSTMYSLGMRPQQIFASQVGQVAGAVQLLAGEGSGFARFLAGPWGLAVTGGAMILGPLIANLLSTGDATTKASQANQTWAEKLDATKHSITEVIAALRDYNAEQKKANETTLDAAAAAAKAAAEKIGEALAERQRLAALLASQQASASGNAGQGTGGQRARSRAVRSVSRKRALPTTTSNWPIWQSRRARRLLALPKLLPSSMPIRSRGSRKTSHRPANRRKSRSTTSTSCARGSRSCSARKTHRPRPPALLPSPKAVPTRTTWAA